MTSAVDNVLVTPVPDSGTRNIYLDHRNMVTCIDL